MDKIPIAVAFGDGVGPEIMQAVLHILNEAKCPLEYHPVLIGEKAYHKGSITGIEATARDKLKNTRAFLKSPSESYISGEYKNISGVFIKNLGLFTNIRPCISYFPFIKTSHPEMNVLIVKGNLEDLHCKIEYLQSCDTAKADRIITYSYSKKIIQFAFEYAKRCGCKKITCMTKDSILTKTDALFKMVFDEVSKYYPDIINDHYPIDKGIAALVSTPEIFDVLVMPGIYGDISSKILSKTCGSTEICPSINIGEHYALFETVHGPAIDIANKGTANPSALLLSAIQMLNYLNLSDYAKSIYRAFLSTIEQGLHTEDIFNENISKKRLNSENFAEEIIKNLSNKPKTLNESVFFKSELSMQQQITKRKMCKRNLVGVDITIFSDKEIDSFLDKISHMSEANLHLKAIFNRGIEIWPEKPLYSNLCDQYSIRFLNNDLRSISQEVVTKLLQDFNRVELEVLNLEYLYIIDGKAGF